jgi:NAD(P)-dependent dehydrogenase (short-subunit alcohol dehydrogenase family)
MLTDKVVVITGGAGLLGRTFCEAVVANNATCIIADINEENGTVAINGIKAKYPAASIFFHELDINSKESVLNLIDSINKQFGRVDAIVNNAYPRNRSYGKHFFDVAYDDFCENVNINLGGYFLVSQQFASFFIKQGYGNIVNISSIYGVVPPRFEVYDGTQMTMPVEYAVIKSGLIHLTKYMAKYLKGKNIKVNAISLGGIEDKQPESFLKNYKEHCLNKGMLNANDISGSLIYLLSDHSKYVNGQNVVVDDGFTL